MSKEKQKEIASKGGKSLPLEVRKEIGRKGGMARARKIRENLFRVTVESDRQQDKINENSGDRSA